jgi:IclR family transcriptional regulator, pca regulon regulatory protein
MTDENGPNSAAQASGSATFVRSVARALKVISGFGVDAPAQTVAQVAARSDLDRATARRVLLTLEELGYLRRDGRQFSLTPRVLELGFAYMSSLPFWSVADDILRELADSLRAFCLIVAIDSSYETVWVVSSVRPPNPPLLAEFPNTGRHTPSHTVAPGILLLGGLTGQELNRALLACTAHDESVSLPALRERIIQDRRQGWSLRVVPKENFTEIAVPLLDAQGRIIAGLSVLSPLSRISADEAVKQYLPRIKQAAEDINRLVGYKAPGP